MKTLPILAALAVLTGCATSPQGLERPEYASSFTVDQPYQLTLKRIVDADQNCRNGPILPVGQVINDVQHYPDLREAKIVQGSSGFGRQIYQVIHVREQGDGSEVTLYAKVGRDRIVQILERWAGGDPACP